MLWMLGEVFAEPVEALFPAGAPLGDPLLGRPQRARLDAAGAHPSHLLGANQPACFEHVQVLDHRRQRHRERSSELAD